MIDNKPKIGIQTIKNGVGTAGIGYLVVPDGSDEDRSEYIENCYRTNTIMINGGEGYGCFQNVLVAENVMQSLHFPFGNERGSAVVWVREDTTKLPVVVATLRNGDDFLALSENQKVIRCNTTSGESIYIVISGEDAGLNINIKGTEIHHGKINIKVNSDNKDSEINISTDNEINVYATNTLSVESNGKFIAQINNPDDGKVKSVIKFENEVGFEYSDEFENEVKITDGEIKIVSEKINHNEGSEPMVLGDTLGDLLSELISAIEQLTVVTPAGTSSTPINAASFEQIKQKINNIKSKYSNLD